jgi:putative addiction module component (TIGR02574 family)
MEDRFLPVSLLSEVQRQELARRAAEDDASPDNVIPWEQVKAQILARLHQLPRYGSGQSLF